MRLQVSGSVLRVINLKFNCTADALRRYKQQRHPRLISLSQTMIQKTKISKMTNKLEKILLGEQVYKNIHNPHKKSLKDIAENP